MFKTIGNFILTFGKEVAKKAAAAAGPAAKAAVLAMDPRLEWKCEPVRDANGDSRIHMKFDASMNLPGDLDYPVASAINNSGLIGLGNSQPAGSEPGSSPSN